MNDDVRLCWLPGDDLGEGDKPIEAVIQNGGQVAMASWIAAVLPGCRSAWTAMVRSVWSHQ